MRVAFIIPSLAQQGPIILVEQLIQQIRNDIYVEVFYFDDIRELNFKCKTTQISFFRNYDFSTFDLIHTHMLRGDLYYYLHKHKINKPAISTIHQYIRPSLRFSYNWFIAAVFTKLWKIGLSKHSMLVCINKHMRDLYKRELANKSIDYVYNGVSPVKFYPVDVKEATLLNGLKERFKLLMSISRLNKQKGIQEVVPFLVDNKDYVYVVIGDGPEFNRLEKIAHELGVSDRFFLLGFKNNATSYLQFADVFVMPSIAEGFGLALAEAASCSIPIVCSNISAFKDMFTKNEVTFFELGDKHSLANAIHQASDDAQVKVKSALDTFNNKFTSKVMAAKYLDLYRRLKKP